MTRQTTNACNDGMHDACQGTGLTDHGSVQCKCPCHGQEVRNLRGEAVARFVEEMDLPPEVVGGVAAYETLPGPTREVAVRQPLVSQKTIDAVRALQDRRQRESAEAEAEMTLLACPTTMCRVATFLPANGTNYDKCPACYAKGQRHG